MTISIPDGYKYGENHPSRYDHLYFSSGRFLERREARYMREAMRVVLDDMIEQLRLEALAEDQANDEENAKNAMKAAFEQTIEDLFDD